MERLVPFQAVGSGIYHLYVTLLGRASPPHTCPSTVLQQSAEYANIDVWPELLLIDSAYASCSLHT